MPVSSTKAGTMTPEISRSATTTVVCGVWLPGTVRNVYVPAGILGNSNFPSLATAASTCAHPDDPLNTTRCPAGRIDLSPSPTTPVTLTPGPDGNPTSTSLSETAIVRFGNPLFGSAERV